MHEQPRRVSICPFSVVAVTGPCHTRGPASDIRSSSFISFVSRSSSRREAGPEALRGRASRQCLRPYKDGFICQDLTRSVSQVCRENARITRVFSCPWNWIEGTSVASTIHRFADHCDARARRGIYRDSFRIQLCILGALRRLYPACGEKITRQRSRRAAWRLVLINNSLVCPVSATVSVQSLF